MGAGKGPGGITGVKLREGVWMRGEVDRGETVRVAGSTRVLWGEAGGTLAGDPGIQRGDVGGPGEGIKRSGTKDSLTWKRSGVKDSSAWI